MRIAVLRNPKSLGNRKAAPPTMPAGIPMTELSGLANLNRSLEVLADKGTDLLVIDGGDGTVREIVSRLPETFGPEQPIIAIRANGNTNLIARKIGRLSSYDKLTALADQPVDNLSGNSKEVPLLRVDGLESIPVRGFIAGWGAYASGTRIAIEEIKDRGGRQVARAVVSILRRSLFGVEAGQLRAGVKAVVAPRGYPTRSGACFAGMSTVLEGSLVGGLSPFWGEDVGRLRWLDVSAPPRRLWLAAPFLAFGKPLNWMLRSGYRSGRSDMLTLKFGGEMVIDGEIYPTSGSKLVVLTANETVRILSL